MEKKEAEKKVIKKAAKPAEKWVLVDATDKILGRLASQVAMVLRGKTKPSYETYLDRGDHVVIINARQIRVTGKKADQIEYLRHSMHPGGQKMRTYREQMEKDPTRIVEHAIRGMVPKNPLGRQVMRKLFVYAGAEHKHQAQKPVELKI